MKIQCPQCRRVVPADQVNMSTDTALCPRCNEAFRVSTSLDLDTAHTDILQNPPGGAWFKEKVYGLSVGATTRSPIAFFLVPFMCVWSGFSIWGIYGTQIVSGKFNPLMSLFGIPFVLASILFWSIALMAVGGKVEVTIRGEDSRVFVGVGSLGWTRRFDWSAVKVIHERTSNVQYPGGYGGTILLEGQERIKFGSNLNEKRRYFVLNALKYLKTTSGIF